MSISPNETARINMIKQQVQTWGVTCEHTLSTIAAVSREQFTPEGFKHLAFAEMMIPLSNDQVMLTPGIEAKILQALQIKKNETVLEIGTGSGYFTALLASQAKKVVSVDIHESLKESAQQALMRIQIDNVELFTGNAADGWPELAPYDVIVFTGSLSEISNSLKDQLNLPGRIFAVIGQGSVMSATVLHYDSNRQCRVKKIFETSIPNLQDAHTPTHFKF